MNLTDDLPDFGLFDRANPRSLFNIVPESVQHAMLTIDRFELLADEHKLKKKVQPTGTFKSAASFFLDGVWQGAREKPENEYGLGDTRRSQ